MDSVFCAVVTVGSVVNKSHACYLLEGAGHDWVQIPLRSNFSGSASGVSGHTRKCKPGFSSYVNGIPLA